jgi:hypothetical protein
VLSLSKHVLAVRAEPVEARIKGGMDGLLTQVGNSDGVPENMREELLHLLGDGSLLPFFQAKRLRLRQMLCRAQLYGIRK